MFDAIHDIAAGFRKVVQAFSYPGEIVSVSSEIEKLEESAGLLPGTLLLAWTLLDSETSFYLPETESPSQQFLRELTFAKWSPLEEARFVFLPLASSEEEKVSVFKNVSTGDLIDPHLGAMIILEVESFTGDTYRLTGPGMKVAKEREIPLHETFVKQRQENNSDYPKGFDLLLLDKQGQLMALPRTTKMERIS